MPLTNFVHAQRRRCFYTCAASIAAVLAAAAAASLHAESAPCTYGLANVTGDLAAAGGAVSIALVTQSGCAWTATSDAAAVTRITPAAGTGAGTVQVQIDANPHQTPRLLNITLGDPGVGSELYVVKQAGRACTFVITSPPPLAPASGGSGRFEISTQPGCRWAATSAPAFVRFNSSSGVADANGSATISYDVDPNTGATATRRATVTVTNDPGSSFNTAVTRITQSGDGLAPPTPWRVGDVVAGIGSWFSDGGQYRTLNPDGSPTGAPALEDAFGGTTTGCMIDPGVAHGDLFTTSWDGLLISRFSDATHQLVSALDLTPAGLASVQRRIGAVPVPYLENLNTGAPWPDFTYSEQLVFDQNGNFFVGGSMYVSGSLGLGHAYLLKFAKNDDGRVPGCSSKSPCLLDWWRVDAAGETPTGQNPAGVNALWTSTYKSAYLQAGGDNAARAAAALAAVAPLAPSLSYQAGTAPQQPGPSGVDELDLSSDQHTVFYTSEDNRIRRFDTETGTQLTPLTISDPDSHLPYWGKAYGFRLLPDGNGHADGSAGLIVAMSIGVFRLDADGSAIKPPGANVIQYLVDPGVATPFAVNLTPDATSFWVATSQQDSSKPTSAGGKIYRFHIPTGSRYGPFNVAASGADIDIQGLCVKREYTAGVNQCFLTDKDGRGVLDGAGNAIAIACRKAAVCVSPGIDANGKPNLDCYPPGQVPLKLDDRTSFEGDRSGADGSSDLDLRPLTAGHDIVGLTNLPPGLQPAVNSATGYIVGVTGIVGWNTCPVDLQAATPLSGVCKSYVVGVHAADGAVTSFTWNIHVRSAPSPETARVITVANQLSFVGIAIAPYAIGVNDPGATSPVTVTVAGLPPGLTYDAATAVVAGVPASGSGNLAGYPVTVTAKDEAGAVATKTFTWAIDTPPVVAAADQWTAINTPVSYTPLASDLDGHALTYAIAGLPDGLTFSPSTGTITGTPSTAVSGAPVAVTVTDPAGASATTTFRWTVFANRPPRCVNAVPGQALWAPNHTFVDVAITGVTDPDGDAVTITVTSIWQDEPLSIQGSGHTVIADASGIGTASARVRAERSGAKGSDGRLYQINFTANDGRGGACTGAIAVGIPHDQGQTTMPTDNNARYDSMTGVRIR